VPLGWILPTNANLHFSCCPTPEDPQYESGRKSFRFPPVTNAKVITDGEVLRVGPLAVTGTSPRAIRRAQRRGAGNHVSPSTRRRWLRAGDASTSCTRTASILSRTTAFALRAGRRASPSSGRRSTKSSSCRATCCSRRIQAPWMSPASSRVERRIPPPTRSSTPVRVAPTLPSHVSASRRGSRQKPSSPVHTNVVWRAGKRDDAARVRDLCPQGFRSTIVMAFQSFIGITRRWRFESYVIDAAVGMPSATSSAF
jgi:hypothetical protein